MGTPPVAASLAWEGDRRFAASARGGGLTLDGDGKTGPSPMETLGISLAGCMAIDVVDIIRKGRHRIDGLEAQIVAVRADTAPRYFVRITLRYIVRGAVPHAAMERAIALSRDKYCSVWHSLRQDIELLTSYEVTA